MPSPLITVAELSDVLVGPSPPRLLDVRWRLGGPSGLDEYRRGHIGGASFVDLERELAGTKGGGRHPMPDAAAFETAMRRQGVDAERGVVVYDSADSTSAARAWWLLTYFGHADTRVLDGGLSAWVGAGHPLSDEVTEPPAGDFTARPGHLPLLDADAAAELTRGGVLLDARAAERFRGDVEPVDPVAGHIPGAVSAPTSANVDAAGRFLPAEALQRHFAALGARPGSPVGAYCGSGVTAAHEVLALAVAGIPAALYVGSWSDWITDPRRPVARGDA